jgi:hypothetical protein
MVMPMLASLRARYPGITVNGFALDTGVFGLAPAG